MKKIITLLLILPLLSSYADTLSFSQAIAIGLENNYAIRMVKKQGEIARNNVSIGNAGMLPKLDVNLGGTYSNTDIEIDLVTGQRIQNEGSVTKTSNYGIDLSWTIFDGYAMFAAYDKFKQLKKKSDIEIQLSIEQTIRQIASIYYAAMAVKQLSELLQFNLKLSEERLDRVRSRAEYGAALSLEILRAEVDLNNDSTQYLQAVLNYSNIKRTLALALGLNTDSKIEIEDTDETINIPVYEALLEQTMQNNNSINKALQEKKITQADKRLIISSIYPRISVRGAYSGALSQADAGFMLRNQSKGFSAAVNFTWNLFDGLKTNIAAENVAILSEINEISYQYVSDQIRSAFASSYDNYINRKTILRISESNIQTARRNFDRTRELYHFGQASSLELREAQLNLLRSGNAINDARYQLKIAETELLLLSGSLMKEGN